MTLQLIKKKELIKKELLLALIRLLEITQLYCDADTNINDQLAIG